MILLKKLVGNPPFLGELVSRLFEEELLVILSSERAKAGAFVVRRGWSYGYSACPGKPESAEDSSP